MRAFIIAALAAIVPVGASAAAPDGKAIFAAHCAVCHSLTGKSTPAGPELKGVVGRKIASAPDFNYSPALKAKAGIWNITNLDAFLAAPQSFAPGSTMPARVTDPAQRAALIAYLKTAK